MYTDASWKEFITEGDKYLKTAVNGAAKRRAVFTPEILYNLVAMAIEKQIMGLLLARKRMPDNHTLRDLMDALKGVADVTDDFYEEVVGMDRFQEICSIAAYHREVPDDKHIEEFLSIGGRVRDLVAVNLPSAVG